MYPNTVYSIELNVTCDIPEWTNTPVTLGLEDEAVFTKEGADWVDGYPREYYFIK